MSNNNLQKDIPVFFIRHNLKDEKLVSALDANNQIAIHLGTKEEKSEWDALLSGKKEKSKSPIVNHFFKIKGHLVTGDVLIIAFYKSDKFKVGLLKRGSEFDTYKDRKYYKYFTLSGEKSFLKSDYPIFHSIIPQQVTISPIHKRKMFPKYLYEERLNQLPIVVNNISDKLIELMCLEWMRSDYCPERWRLNNQLLLVGGNYAKIDIYGTTINGKLIAAQVTNADSSKTTEDKKDRLKDFKKADIKLMFSNSGKTDKEVAVIKLDDVLSDLLKSLLYKDMLTKFVRE